MSEWQETRHSPPGIRNRRRGGVGVLVGRTRDSWMCMFGGRGYRTKEPYSGNGQHEVLELAVCNMGKWRCEDCA